jgi:hypothetical protein
MFTRNDKYFFSLLTPCVVHFLWKPWWASSIILPSARDVPNVPIVNINGTVVLHVSQKNKEQKKTHVLEKSYPYSKLGSYVHGVKNVRYYQRHRNCVSASTTLREISEERTENASKKGAVITLFHYSEKLECVILTPLSHFSVKMDYMNEYRFLSYCLLGGKRP